MHRITVAILMLAALTAAPVLAQQHGHVVAMPDTLKWVEPATLPGTRLAVLQGDPSKEGLFVYRLTMPAQYKIPPHFHKASAHGAGHASRPSQHGDRELSGARDGHRPGSPALPEPLDESPDSTGILRWRGQPGPISLVPGVDEAPGVYQDAVHARNPLV